jgi:hypothetical protein
LARSTSSSGVISRSPSAMARRASCGQRASGSRLGRSCSRQARFRWCGP